MPSPIGSLMGHAEQKAALLGFAMDKTYKARLAKHVKEELAKGTHYQDVKLGIDLVLSRRLSPFLLARKIEDLHKVQGRVPTQVIEDDPFEDFPTY